MGDVEKIIEFMCKPPEPAAEVVTLDRSVVIQLLADREHKGPLDPVVTYLRAELALPKVELWAMHSVGPGEIFPALDRDHAEKMVADMGEACEREKQRRIDAGESLEHWCDWVVNIVPSPWEPIEHFEELARQSIDEEEGLRSGWSEAEAKVARLTADNASLRGSCAKLGAEHAGMVRTVRKQEKELGGLRKDARRYQFLRSEMTEDQAICMYGDSSVVSGNYLDEAVDAFMNKEGKA